MALFQKSVLDKYLKLQDQQVIEKAYRRFTKYFHNPERQQNIKDIKEEGFQQKFLIELFVNVFEYVINPDPRYNLTTEYKNEKGAKKADGAILKDRQALAVIELKSTKTKDLESIRQQAFDYKSNQTGCVYVVTSNFEKLRFYVNYSVEFEEFNLFNLSAERFALMYLCLHQDNLLSNKALEINTASVREEKIITDKFYAAYSVFKRELYRDLVKQNLANAVFRTELAKEDTERANKNIKLTLFKKSQKLIDRFLFIFFGEDRGLLPPNSTILILQNWKKLQELDEEVPLYNRFKKYFNYLDKGRKGTEGKAEIFAYNGGLFQPDPVLDSLMISDELLYKHTKELSQYNFDSQIDVNILGHIFENSLNEIESVNAEIEGVDFDKQTTKRKKDGVFYTPKYITKYIVDNTVGKLCTEKKAELGIKEEVYFKSRKGRTAKKLKELQQLLDTYREWMLTLTILDPACGSGAFLNQALDFLIKEHRYIDELTASLLGGSIVFQDIENTILENNIYGVDLNEESIEIAKLSLWLRTAQPRRKLNDLSSNIKCGNSLIETKAVAGDKAFKWENEFSEIFENGGFDILIGNPPYVGEKGHAEIFDDLKKIPKWKEFYRRRSNTYYFFIKHGIDLLKDNGIQSLIIPREFTNADWANKVRETILENSQIIEIIDFSDLKVFSDAGTTSLILTQQKAKKNIDYQFQFIKILIQDNIQNELFNNECRRQIKIDSLKTEDHKPWDFNSFRIDFNNKIKPLSVAFNVSQGIVSGSDKVTKKHIVNGLASESDIGRGVFILDENIDIKFNNEETLIKINDEWIKLTGEDINLIKPYYKPENLQKWTVTRAKQFIVYVGKHNMTENIKKYLLQYDKILLNRSTITEQTIELADFLNYTIDEIKKLYSSAGSVQKIMRRKQWYLPLYERANVPFDSEKIVVNTKNMDVFTYTDKDLYSSGGGAGGQNFIYLNSESEITKSISEHTETDNFVSYVNAILNSKIIRFIIKSGQYNQLSTSKIADLPIRLIDFNDSRDKVIFDTINTNTTLLRKGNTELNTLVKNFRNYLFTTLAIRITKNWHELEFGDFISELNKAIKKGGGEKLSKIDEMEWMEVFESKKAEALTLKSEIDKTDKEIDQMVYELYGLNEEEIAIIEGRAK